MQKKIFIFLIIMCIKFINKSLIGEPYDPHKYKKKDFFTYLEKNYKFDKEQKDKIKELLHKDS